MCSAWLQDLPDYTDASAYNYAEKTKVYANDGTTLLAEFFLENRDPIELSQMGDYVTKAPLPQKTSASTSTTVSTLWASPARCG